MNMNPIKQIYKFNEQAGLLNQGYSDQRECAFPIEEAVEQSKMNSPKQFSRDAVKGIFTEPVSDVDRLDKHLDIIVYSLGSIFKLGLSPQEAMKALSIVAEKNMEKLNAGQDEAGKQKKPVGFVGPEKELQKILDSL